MANYFSLILDTLAPTISTFKINNGASVTTSSTVSLSIAVSDASTTGYTMKIWGISGAADEASASWESYATTKSVTLPSSTDGSYTISIKVRDDVYNESSASTATITLSTSLPTITITGPDVTKISEVSGKNICSFSFTSNVTLKDWKVKLVPQTSSGEGDGTQIPATGGSTGMTGTTLAASTAQSCKIYGADLKTACGGSDGTYVIKVFGQSNENSLWSA